MNSQLLKPEFQIGKSGITDNLIRDINVRLKKRKTLKIKFLPAAIKGKNKEELFNEIVTRTKSKLIQKIGFTIVIRYARN